MEVKRVMARLLLIFTVIQLVYAKNPFNIQQDSVEVTNAARFGVARFYIKNNNLNLIFNLTKQVPTNMNMFLKLWHRNSRGKYDMIGIPWSSKACQFIQTDKIVYDSLRNLKSTELPEKCPLEPGHYYVKDYDVNQITIPIALPMGQYRLEVRGVSGKEELVKATWNGRIAPA